MSDLFAPRQDAATRIQKLLEERDKEYQRMEELFQKREKDIQDREAFLNKQGEELSLKENALFLREEACVEKETQLSGKEETLRSKEEELWRKQASFEEKRQQADMEATVLREETRNEKLKAQRLSKEYEARMLSFDGFPPAGGEKTAQGQEGQEKALAAKMEECEILRQQLRDLQEENETLQEGADRLLSENQHLQEEKKALFLQLMDVHPEPMPENEFPGTDQAPGSWEGADRGFPEIGTEDEEDRLTAEGFHKFIKGEEAGIHAQLLHAKDGSLVVVEDNGIKVVFAFKEPAYFDIRKPCKDGRAVRKMIKKCNERADGIEFSYDDTEGEVMATGYFDTAIKADDLLSSVQKGIACFFGNQKEGA